MNFRTKPFDGFVIHSQSLALPIMQQNLKAGLDLPIRVLIWDENGQTKIGYLDPAALKARYNIGVGKAFKQMIGVLGKFTSAAAQ